MPERMSVSANDKLSRIVARLESRPLQPLAPKRVWDRELDDEIASLAAGIGASGARKASIALMAGLHLRNDSLDRSHAYAQEIEDDPTGGYWHGIIHRMEGDYWNANYWFSQAGRHPVMEKLYTRASDYIRNEVKPETLRDGKFRDYLRHGEKREVESDGIFRDDLRHGVKREVESDGIFRDNLRYELKHEALPEGSFLALLRSLVEQGAWNAFTFTKLVEAAQNGRAREEALEVLERIQHIELAELLAYTLGAAGK
jgi:hypothetical protein